MPDQAHKRPESKSLEDQLASVVEGEGVSLYSNDGVHVMAGPSAVRVRRVRRRRRRSRGAHHQLRPTVSKRVVERDQNDEVAALDRVIVGFAKRQAKTFRQYPIAIRSAEHDRSPFVVSLRDLLFSHTAPTKDERVPLRDAFGHELEIQDRTPGLALIEQIAKDLRVSEPEVESYVGQFTPTSFTSAFKKSYGPVQQIVSSVGNALTDFASLFRRQNTRISILPSPAQESVDDSQAQEEPARERVLSRPRWSYARAFIGIAGLIVVATLPGNTIRLYKSFAGTKVAVTEAGVAAIAEARSMSPDLPSSIESLRKASERFREADKLLRETNALAVGIASVVPSTHSSYGSAKALVEVGSKTTQAAGLLATGLDQAMRKTPGNILERLRVFSVYAEGALPVLDDAFTALSDVNPEIIPEDKREDVEALTSHVEDARIAVREFIVLSTLLTDLLGENGFRRYLIVFQNPYELRPTGGFIGSYAELDLDKGAIKRLDIPGGGTYDMQGALTAQVVPPAPLQLVAERWEFQDANWSPDFPTSAEKMRYFWSKAGGYTLDGIIAVNATIIPDLLRLTGPIALPDFGKTIDADNFMLEVQKSVELEYDREENQPKKILGTLAPELMERLKNLPDEQLLELLTIFSGAITKKDIQLALTDEKKDELAQSFGWSGRLKQTTGDSLAVTVANIAGQKTDSAVRESVHHAVLIRDDGRITDTVTLTREHTASKGELFRGVRNVAYIRVYVPSGSTLLESSGFNEPEQFFFSKPREDAVSDPDEKNIQASLARHPSGAESWDQEGRTVFAGWDMIDPGETNTLSFTYKLPFTVFDLRERQGIGQSEDPSADVRAAYSLLLTSQSGKPDRNLKVEIIYPDSWTTRWSHSGSTFEGPWDRDRVISNLYTTN